MISKDFMVTSLLSLYISFYALTYLYPPFYLSNAILITADSITMSYLSFTKFRVFIFVLFVVNREGKSFAQT